MELIGDLFVAIVAAGCVLFAYWCGKNDCSSNRCYRTNKD